MLATLVIGLREGLEATLIVGIIAAFLRRNRIPLGPMWAGVTVAVLMSIGVGVGLQAVEQALPQSQQEGMEAVIGIVAVVFVTGMIVWMRKHSRGLRVELEESATAAASKGTAWALAGMAFLAVLKEGFETAVFLLATFQASSNTGLAAIGALLGVAGAVVIGLGIYTGGVKLDLGKFFAGTGVFLVFVAAGLVLTVLRRAHEAGWLLIGQQRTVDLTWLAPNGSVQGALVTGVLGIPPDPRVIEVLGWACYIVPVLAITLWPRAWRPTEARVPAVRVGIAAGLAVAAAALAIAVPLGGASVPTTAPVAGDGGSGTVRAAVSGSAARLTVDGDGLEARVAFPGSTHRSVTRSGATLDRWRTRSTVSSADRPTTMTIDDLVALFGRVPVGISTAQNPGPFTAHWSTTATRTLWASDGGVVDARDTERAVLTLSGGGLPSSRTTTVDRTVWSVPSAHADRVTTDVVAAQARARELVLWKAWLPIALGIAAAVQLVLALRDRRRIGGTVQPEPDRTDAPVLVGDTARSTADALR